MSRRNLALAGVVLAAAGIAAASRSPRQTVGAAAAGGPPSGKYACYQFGFNAQMFFNGVTVVIQPGGHYTTAGASFTGDYRFVPQGARIIYTSGKLAGLKSWYIQSAGGQAIYITFHDGKATNTAVCGRMH